MFSCQRHGQGDSTHNEKERNEEGRLINASHDGLMDDNEQLHVCREAFTELMHPSTGQAHVNAEVL
ncbi:hypothetical protein EXN66_Car020097 [Channa argus]|uniref:Uncharacterized protein n=1 Tax=Channa argus TaxID=215402 RepID=A0A6G1QQA3_CHAAH|nr:hypothetical protein EXN66_Car020097 [Channa argus]